MKIRGAIFDMDGTTVDSLMFWDYLWKKIGEKYFSDPSFRPSDEVNTNIRTMIYVDAMTYFKEYYKIQGRTEDFVAFAASGLSDFYKTVAKVKAGAPELLSYLKEQGITLCLASATAMAEIKCALEHHGLLKYFDFVLSCADIGVGKERPDIYIQAKELMGLSEDEICVFEDSYVALETAKRAGFKTVGVYDKYSPEQNRLAAASDVYLSEGQTLATYIDLMKN